LPWDDDAQALLDEWVSAEPVLVQISAAKRWRDAGERAARAAGHPRVLRQHLGALRPATGVATNPMRNPEVQA
jgi:chlorophyllide a reductase subunit Z